VLLLQLSLVLLVSSVAAVPVRPLLAPWYRVVGDGERLLLEHAQRLVVLEGAAVRELLPALLPLLDGTRTIDELAARLGSAIRPAIAAALELLSARGVVVEGPDAPREERVAVHAAAAAYGLTPAESGERLRSATAGFVGAGSAGPEILRFLHAAGIGGLRHLAWHGRGRCDLAIVAPAPDELDRLSAWNRSALRGGGRWLLVRPFDGRVASVGPLVVPGQTCCYECMLCRRAANSGFGRDLADIEAAPLAARPEAGLDAFTAALAANIAARWLIGRDKTQAGAMITLETRPILRLEEHVVLRVPRCTACSRSSSVAPPLPWHAAAA
jgi:bacteriocin biosynthesis cyclodehydratase domain-containing protein